MARTESSRSEQWNRLFEYLRHEQVADHAALHLELERKHMVSGQAAAFQKALALKSWHRPSPVLRRALSPEPRGHHEFFRAVSA